MMTIIILLISFLLKYTSCVTPHHVININELNGTNSPSCLNGIAACKSLAYVANKTNTKQNVTLKISSPLKISSNIAFSSYVGLTIIGDGPNVTTLVCTSSGKTGLNFSNTTTLTLFNFSISKCGIFVQYLNTTATFMVAVLVEECRGINITQVLFHDNNGYGLEFKRSVNMTITNSIFKDNYYRQVSSDHLTVGGGMSVYHDYQTQHQSYYITISSVIFDSNSANTVKIHKYSFNKIGGGLGLQLQNQTNVTLSVSDCTFLNNSAASGGGMHIFLASSSSYNKLTFTNCNFTDNKAPLYSGGGLDIYISVYNDSKPVGNVIHFKSCNFIGNRAKNGGGVSIYSPRSPCTEIVDHNHIIFHESIFTENEANTSAAVDINNKTIKSYGDTFLTDVTFRNCQFKRNSATQLQLNKNFKYTSFRIMFTVDISLKIEGKETLFKDNIGTALYIASTTVTFSKKSVTQFINNTGYRGGAILLTENGVMEVEEYSKLNFTHNKARLGGAICILPNIFYYVKTCFIQRDCYLRPDKHKKGCTNSTSQYTFTDNTAEIGFGHDIFASTFSNCRGYTGGSIIDLFKGHKMGQFNFSRPLSESVATAVSRLSISDPHLHAYPGIPQSINITQHDDLGNKVTKYFSLYASLENQKGPVRVDKAYRSLSSNKIVFTGEVNKSAALLLETTDLSNSAVKVNVSLLQCPPGYTYYNDTSKCHCSSEQQSSTSKRFHYISILQCSPTNNYSALIDSGQWAGYVYLKGEMQFATASCSFSLCGYPQSKRKDGKHYLPLNRSLLSDYVCSSNRAGVLCGDCKPHYTTYYHSPTYECRDNRNCQSGIAFYLLSEILPVTVIFLVITIFDVNLTSGAMYSFIFYSQILNSQFNNVYTIILRENHWLLRYTLEFFKMIYGIFDFEILENAYMSYCVLPRATVMDILLLKYASTFYAFFLIVATIIVLKLNSFYACIKFCHKCGRRNIRGSVINGLTAFLVLSYYRCLVITVKILFFSKVFISNYTRIVPFYNGNMSFMKGSHLKYVIPALLCFVCIIIPPPLILISEPFLIWLNGRYNFRRNRFTFCLHRLRIKMKPFLDSFQGCFRDNCRVFAGLFFLYRILIVPSEYFNGIVWNNSFEGVVLFFILLLHSLSHPFQKWRHNHLDIFLLVNLLIINFLMIIEYLMYLHEPVEVNFRDDKIVSKIIGIMILILVLLPLLYLCTHVYRKLFSKTNELSTNHSDDIESLPARLLNSQVDTYGSINN